MNGFPPPPLFPLLLYKALVYYIVELQYIKTDWGSVAETEKERTLKDVSCVVLRVRMLFLRVLLIVRAFACHASSAIEIIFVAFFFFSVSFELSSHLCAHC